MPKTRKINSKKRKRDGDKSVTSDHKEILYWAERRGAVPTIMDRADGMLEFEFDQEFDPQVFDSNWQEFFKIFDRRKLKMQIDTNPHSRYHRFIA